MSGTLTCPSRKVSDFFSHRRKRRYGDFIRITYLHIGMHVAGCERKCHTPNKRSKMKRSICVITSIVVAAAMGPIGLSVAQADNGNHYGWDKQKPQHSQTAQLKRNDDKENDKKGKHADWENQNQRHNQNGQLTRNDHDGKDNNGKHVGWDKHIGKPTGDWTSH